MRKVLTRLLVPMLCSVFICIDDCGMGGKNISCKLFAMAREEICHFPTTLPTTSLLLCFSQSLERE